MCPICLRLDSTWFFAGSIPACTPVPWGITLPAPATVSGHQLLSPFEERELLDLGLGITNIVARATASADVLSGEELMAGARRLKRKIRRYQPAAVAFLGLGAYRLAFGQRLATLGKQPERLAGSEIWILPNPSGLNAHYQLVDLARLFRELRLAVQRKP